MRRVGVVVRPSDIPNCSAVFNPAVHRETENEIHLFCRVQNDKGISEIHRLILNSRYEITSVDAKSILTADDKDEQLGCEDPRLTEIEGTHYLAYTAYKEIEGVVPHTRIGLASSHNLQDFTRLGLILPELGNNKNGVLLCGKPNGSYWLYHRIYPHIWIASSPDLKCWQNPRPVMFTRPMMWDSVRIGIGTIIETKAGYLAFYHGADGANVYRMGVALFDLDKPYKLLSRSRQPLLEPGKRYERKGDVPNVVFPCGAIELSDTFVIFYGAADKVIAAAELTKKEVFQNLQPI